MLQGNLVGTRYLCGQLLACIRLAPSFAPTPPAHPPMCAQQRPQAMLEAKDLPHCELSKYLEQRLVMSLDHERQARAAKVSVQPVEQGLGNTGYVAAAPGWSEQWH